MRGALLYESLYVDFTGYSVYFKVGIDSHTLGTFGAYKYRERVLYCATMHVLL